jgi:hypothetical protein
MNDLKIKDVRAIGGTRFDNGYLKRNPFIPFTMILGFLIIIMAMVVTVIQDNDEYPQYITYTSASGEMAVLDLEHKSINVDNEIYLREAIEDSTDSQYDAVFWLLILGLIVFCVPFVIYITAIDKFKDKFVQHWVDKKEFLSADEKVEKSEK